MRCLFCVLLLVRYICWLYPNIYYRTNFFFCPEYTFPCRAAHWRRGFFRCYLDTERHAAARRSAARRLRTASRCAFVPVFRDKLHYTRYPLLCGYFPLILSIARCGRVRQNVVPVHLARCAGGFKGLAVPLTLAAVLVLYRAVGAAESRPAASPKAQKKQPIQAAR